MTHLPDTFERFMLKFTDPAEYWCTEKIWMMFNDAPTRRNVEWDHKSPEEIIRDINALLGTMQS